MQSSIRIDRKRERWRDQGRSYKVIVDGRMVGRVRNGQQQDFVVTPGQHRIRIKVDWSGSRDVSLVLENGESRTLVCHPKGSAMSSPIRLFSRRAWVDLYEPGSTESVHK